MMISKESKILVIGLGLIGGSYCQGLTKKGYYVGGIDKDKNAIKYALENNLIKVGKSEYSKEFISSFDIVIFALYPKKLEEVILEIKDYFKDGAIITDTTGVKGSLISKIQKSLPKNVEFIGAHPMAGKEVCGIKNASCEIFKNANYIITPTSKNTQNGVLVCSQIGEELNFRKVSILSPKKHDEMIGFLSQLTHILAISLMTCQDSKNLVDYTGDSFRDLTRIAKINENMWAELFEMNKAPLLKEMNLFLDKFIEIKNLIEEDNFEKLKEIMKKSTKNRELFDK